VITAVSAPGGHLTLKRPKQERGYAVSNKSEDIIASLGRKRLKTVPLAEMEKAISQVLGELAGDTYKTKIDKLEFDRDWMGEKAEIVLRIERIRPDPFDLGTDAEQQTVPTEVEFAE
jgi:hypothetical protein